MADATKCQVTAQLKDQTGFGPLFECEGIRGHKGHHHFQVNAVVHRPQEECRHCDAVKPDKRAELKAQVSFWIT